MTSGKGPAEASAGAHTIVSSRRLVVPGKLNAACVGRGDIYKIEAVQLDIGGTTHCHMPADCPTPGNFLYAKLHVLVGRRTVANPDIELSGIDHPALLGPFQ